MADPNITTDEVVAVFHELEPAVRQAIFIAVLERRNNLLQADLAAARHAVENYETFVKQGEKPAAEE